MPRAHGIVRPAKRDRGDTGMARRQPAAELQQQTVPAFEQRWRQLDAPWQFQPFLELLGQGDPLVRFGPQAVGLVHRLQQLATETPGHAAARQRPEIAQCLAADVAQRGGVGAGCREDVQRQSIEQLLMRTLEPVLDACPCQGQRRDAVRRPGQRGRAEHCRLGGDAITKRALAPEQAHRRLDLDDDSLVQIRDTRCKLQGPGRELSLCISGSRLAGFERESQSRPQHRAPR